MRIMTENPLNAETLTERLRTWITDNNVFFKRNQGMLPESPVGLNSWPLIVDGLVGEELKLKFTDILGMPKVEMANTLECSGNSRSILLQKALGNPWTIGGVGNAIWGGIWLKDLLNKAGIRQNAQHVYFEGIELTRRVKKPRPGRL
jgi:DMSO/TMAO reductase YedYZ molybdopterin-dependent catalytic subunit